MAQQLRSHAALADDLSAKAQPGNSQHVVTSSPWDPLSSSGLCGCLYSHTFTFIQTDTHTIKSKEKSNYCFSKEK